MVLLASLPPSYESLVIALLVKKSTIKIDEADGGLMEADSSAARPDSIAQHVSVHAGRPDGVRVHNPQHATEHGVPQSTADCDP